MLGRRSLRSFGVSRVLRVVLVATAFAIPPSRIRADAPPFAPNVAIGRPIHPVALSFEGSDALFLARAGKREALPARSASEVTVEVAPVADDAAVAVIRVSTPDGPWVGLLGGRSGTELLLFERAEPFGDPGERRAREVVVRDGQVRTGLRYEGVTACAQRPAWLEASAIDPSTLKLVPARPLALPPGLDDATVQPLAAASAPPRSTRLIATASSVLDGPTQLPRVPRAAVDGDAARGLLVRDGELLTFRHGAVPIERFELSVQSPKQVELWLYDDSERGVRVVVPGKGQRRVSVEPRAAMTGHCLALVVAEGQPLELREVAAYGSLDRPGGLDQAIALMVQDDAQAGPLAEALEQLGPEAAERLAARWPELSARGKRRSLKVLLRALDRAPVRSAVLESARAEDPELREATLHALERAGEPGRVALRQLVMTADGDRCAALLAHPEELPTLLLALAADGGSERGPLREAIVRALRQDPAAGATSVSAWRASGPSASAQIALALALSEAGLADATSELADTLLEVAESFPDRYRLAAALAASAPSATSDAWLTEQSVEAQEWMQRRAAFDALARRGAANVPTLADKLSHDAYPRVRAATLGPLLRAGRRAIVDVMLVQDEWPMVRAEAAAALAHAPNNRAALETALADGSARVRRAAVDALAVAHGIPSWPAVEKRARDNKEALDVRMAAVSFAGGLCVSEARDTLTALVGRLDAPDASEAETELALEALRVLHDLGGEAQRQGASLVQKAGTPELAAMWGRLPSPRCTATRPAATSPGA